MSVPKSTNVIFDELKRVIDDVDNLVGTPISNLHGVITTTSLSETRALPTHWYVSSAGFFSSLPSFADLANVIAANQAGYSILSDTDTRVTFVPPVEDASKAHLFLSSVIVPGTTDFQIEIDAPGYEVALYVNGILIGSGMGNLFKTLTLQSGRQNLYVICNGGTLPITLITPETLQIRGQIPRPEAPLWAGIPYTDDTGSVTTYNVLQWRNDPMAGSWRIYKAEGIDLGIPDSAVNNSDGTYTITYNGEDLTHIPLGTILYLYDPSARELKTAGAITDRTYSSGNTAFTIVLNFRAPTTVADWDSYHFLYPGMYQSVTTVGYNNATTVSWSDTSVATDTLYLYRITALDFITGTVESVLSKEQPVWVYGKPQITGYLTATPFVVTSGSAIDEFIRPASDVGNSWLVSPSGAAYAVLDETSPSDADQIYTSGGYMQYPSYAESAARVTLTNPSGTPGSYVHQYAILHIRTARADIAGQGWYQLIVRLYEGSTLRVERELYPGTTTATYPLSITDEEYASIGNHNNLELEIIGRIAFYDELSGTTDLSVTYAALEYVSRVTSQRGVKLDLHYTATTSVRDLEVDLAWNDEVPNPQTHNYTKNGVNGVDGTERLQGPTGDFFLRDDYSNLVVTITPLRFGNGPAGTPITLTTENVLESAAGTAFLVGSDVIKADYAVAGTNVTIDIDTDGRPRINASAGSVSGINDLTDVTITSITDNEVLQYDSGTAQWRNQTLAEAGISAVGHTHSYALDDLTDVVITTPASGHLLRHNGSNFVNVLGIATGDITSGTLSVTRGGTGVSDPTTGNLLVGAGASAMTLLAPGAAGGYVRSDGSAWVRSTIQAGDIPGHTHAVTDLTPGTNGQFLGVSGGVATWLSVVALGDGTSSAPAFTFLSETDMGMYRAASSQLGGNSLFLGVGSTSTLWELSVNYVMSHVHELGIRDRTSSGINAMPRVIFMDSAYTSKGSFGFLLDDNILRLSNSTTGHMDFMLTSTGNYYFSKSGSTDDLYWYFRQNATVNAGYLAYLNTGSITALASLNGRISLRPGTGGTATEVLGVYTDRMESTKKLHIAPGSDVSIDLLTVGVTGDPKFAWSETGDKFTFSKDVSFNSGVAILNGPTAISNAYALIQQAGASVADFGYGDTNDEFTVNVYATGTGRIRLKPDSAGRVEITDSGSDEQLRIVHASAAGSPYLSFYQTTTRRAYLQSLDTGDAVILASEYGYVELWGGSGGTEVQGIRVGPTSWTAEVPLLMGSATAPLTGTGIFLGKDGADYEFRVGNIAAGKYIHWDGSVLLVAGDLINASNLSGGTAAAWEALVRRSFQGARNLLFNHDFEDDTDFWSSGTGVSIVNNSTNAYSGFRYAELTVSGAGSNVATIQQDDTFAADRRYPVRAGDKVKISGWIYRVSGTRPAYISIETLDKDLANPNYYSTTNVTGTGAWTYVETTFTVADGQTSMKLYLQLWEASPANSATVRFDNISLKILVEAGDIMANTITAAQVNTLDMTAKNFVADTGYIGGWLLSSSKLSAANMELDSNTQQIRIATAPGSLTASSGVGVFLGRTGAGVYEFRAGDPAGDYIRFDGTTFTIKANTFTGANPVFTGSLEVRAGYSYSYFGVSNNASELAVDVRAGDASGYGLLRFRPIYPNGGGYIYARAFTTGPTDSGDVAAMGFFTTTSGGMDVYAYGLTHIERGSDEILRLRQTSGTGNPYISFYQNTTRVSYIQHLDSGDVLYLVSEVGRVQVKTQTTLDIEQNANNDEVLRLLGNSSTGNPALSWYQGGTRRSYIQHQDSGDNLVIISEYGLITLYTGSGGTTVPRFQVNHNGIASLLNSSSDEQLRIDHATSNGSPYISFYQAGTRRSYIQHYDGSDELRIVDEYGGIVFYAGSGGSTTNVAIFLNTGIQFTGSAGVKIGTSIGDGTGIKAVYSATTTWNPGSIGIASATNTTLTVTGAAVGDACFVVNEYGDQDNTNLHTYARVSASNTVKVWIHNSNTSGAIDPGSRTIRVVVMKF